MLDTKYEIGCVQYKNDMLSCASPDTRQPTLCTVHSAITAILLDIDRPRTGPAPRTTIVRAQKRRKLEALTLAGFLACFFLGAIAASRLASRASKSAIRLSSKMFSFGSQLSSCHAQGGRQW